MKKNIFQLCFLCFILLHLHSCAQPTTATQSTSTKNDTMNFEINKPDSEWKKTLSEEQYYVLREKGTEKPYSGKFLLHKEDGFYTCAACGNKLFDSASKFDSHCGWPSFDKQIESKAIVTHEDNSHGMRRTEILCGKCGGHLGHIFDDGPTSTGMRYCVNSLSLSFEKANTETTTSIDTLTLAGGCFWCIETIFQDLKGVQSAVSGYSGGSVSQPTYKEVCSGLTGHAEVVQIVYDPQVISMEMLLKVFFTVHDPTTLNRQGADMGTQYRSSIFYRNEDQKAKAENVIKILTDEKVYEDPIVTELVAFEKFYPAEDYHQDYYNNNTEQPYCSAVITPKKAKFEKVFKEILKEK